MSAVIETIISDQNRGDYWIEKKVVRVGSGSDCDVRLSQSDIPSHVATVRFRNGQYVVYNRSNAEIEISDRRIAPDQSDVWHANESVAIAPDVLLQLVVDGDPAPCAQPDNEMLEDYQQKRSEERRLKSIQEAEAKQEQVEEEATKTKVKSSSSQNAIGAFLIGIALLGAFALAAAFLILELGVGSEASSFKPTGVAKSLLARSSELPPRLVQLLQEAQQSVEILDRDLAITRFGRLQAELAHLKQEGNSLTIAQADGAISYEDALRAYINEYLSQLEKE